MDKQRGKVLVLGPKRCGKTRIANFLSGFEESPNFEVYKPTAGTRILEFERIAKAGKTSINMQVELWDCSGDRQYESCWTAILRETQGVVLVYDPTIKEQEKDIELWYKTFVSPLGLRDGQILVFAHQAGQIGASSYQAPRALENFKFANTTLDSDEGSATAKQVQSRSRSPALAPSLHRTTPAPRRHSLHSSAPSASPSSRRARRTWRRS